MTDTSAAGTQTGSIKGYLAQYDSADGVVTAVRGLRKLGYRKMDAFSPFPLDELSEALQPPKSRIPRCVLAGGVLGGVLAYGMQVYSSVFDYPIVSGGKPYNAWPVFIPVTFEMIILGATLCGILAWLVICGLPRLHHPVFSIPEFSSASRDRFFLFVDAGDQLFDSDSTAAELRVGGALQVSQVGDDDW